MPLTTPDAHTLDDLRHFAAENPDVAAKYGLAVNLRADVELHLNKGVVFNLLRVGSRTNYRQRRCIEHLLADYLEEVGGFPELVRALRACRCSGNWGYHDTPAGARIVVAWDQKCGLARLCPDESRVEGRRLARRYLPHFVDWAARSPWHRVQKFVVTWPNIPAAELARFKRLQFQIFNKLQKRFRAVKGSLITQEDPLSRRGDWNLHLNVLALVHGRFSWEEVRAAWFELSRHLFPECEAPSYQIDFQQLDKDPRALHRAVLECIKYPVKHVTEKANYERQRRGADRSEAPDIGHRGGSDRAGGAPVAGHGAPVAGEAFREYDAGSGAARAGGDREYKRVGRDHDRGRCGPLCAADVDGTPGDAAGAVLLDHARRIEAVAGNDDRRGAPESGEDERAAPRERARAAAGDVRGAHAGDQGLAPAMIDWPHDRFREWWAAGKGFRRTRSYGALFRIPKPEPDKLEGVTWCGRVDWQARWKCYKVSPAQPAVDLIQANKSRGKTGPPAENSATGPPGGGSGRWPSSGALDDDFELLNF